METPKTALLGRTLDEIQQIVRNLGMPKFAAKQITSWLYDKKVETIDEMTNLSLKHREALKEGYEVGASAPVEEMRSVDGTVKYLFRTPAHNFIEAVYIPDEDRATLCVSSQVGCKMNCKFCMPEAESVMLSHQFCLALRELGRLMERAGEEEYAAYVKEQYEILKERINEAAWGGKWYARALSSKGNIGSSDSPGSRIYLNAQTWAVLAGVADKEKLPLVLEAVDSMEQDFGFPLNLPPYPAYDPHVGRMSGMLPGLFENGGVYCHATGFKILMDCCAGRATKAVQTLKKIMPDSEKNPSARSGAEPYVFTNCYSTHPGYYGKSYQSWTTGTSVWCLMGLYEGILGIKRDYEGLRIHPCFLAQWEEAEVTRHFRGADYHIVIRNPEHLENGTAQIRADGVLCDSDLLPDYRDGQMHEIEIILK